MNDINLNGFNAIKADQALLIKTKARLMESPGRKPLLNMRRIVAAACLVMLLGATGLHSLNDRRGTIGRDPGVVRMADGSVQIPVLSLPDRSGSGLTTSDMIGLIVYRGRIYTQTSSSIEPGIARTLTGEKLGRTKGNIDEWSKPGDYNEFASTIGVMDVFSVKGYDPDFRIIAYQEYEDDVVAEIYESLNGITVKDGRDIIGKLNMSDNIVSARYQTHSDWYYTSGSFGRMDNIELLNSAIVSLNVAMPDVFDNPTATVERYWNDKDYRRLFIKLTDGSEVCLVVLSNGHVRYGYTDVGFKLAPQILAELWQELTK